MAPFDFAAVADRMPLDRDPASVRRRVEAIEQLMEGLVAIPGTRRRVGLDVALNLIPIVGPTIAAAMGSWLVWEARNLGLSKWQIGRMFGNIGIDWALGLIPWIGAVPDFFFRSNTRNLRLIRRHLDRHHPSTVTLDQRSRA